MGVAHWNFSTDGDTVENASLLARSEYYPEWRRTVQQIFEAVNSTVVSSLTTRNAGIVYVTGNHPTTAKNICQGRKSPLFSFASHGEERYPRVPEARS